VKEKEREREETPEELCSKNEMEMKNVFEKIKNAGYVTNAKKELRNIVR